MTEKKQGSIFSWEEESLMGNWEKDITEIHKKHSESVRASNDTIKNKNDKYRAAIIKGRIVYTCNCGWLDLTHAFTRTKRKYIGADNLWKQLTNESGLKSKSPNEAGFLVIYRQDARVGTTIFDTKIGVNVGVTKKYFIKNNLSDSTKEKIALSIFKEVSLEFEELQSYGVIIGRGDSSFEPADLISNLLGFYNVLRPKLTEERIFKLAKKLSIQQSLEIYSNYPGTFSLEKYKNKKFTPLFFQNKYCNSPSFPPEFQEILTEKKGNNFRDWIELIDVHAGIPPLNKN